MKKNRDFGLVREIKQNSSGNPADLICSIYGGATGILRDGGRLSGRLQIKGNEITIEHLNKTTVMLTETEI